MNAIIAAEEWAPPTDEEIQQFASRAVSAFYRPDTRDDAEMIESIVMEAVADGLAAYNPDRGATWETLAWSIIRWRIHSHRRAEAVRSKHVRFVEFTSGQDSNGRLRRGQWLEPGTRDDDTPQERREFWETALAGLSERDTEVVRLRFMDGLSPDEIASEVGVSQARVYQLLAESLKRIRRNLNRAGLGER